ncbi:caspase-8 [Corythoichthys intestinalis]|uniref:caspase-8 n=1 Tax=Corythoichthys intestinalis TaxID=161448 RepID=UPI0025A52EA9|nr:caspase-8 [Corythoichthys intestinalis]XP_057714143.1 caspase-8 [Corythoichthys intestinalis]
MDRQKMIRITEALGSSEVAALGFLCRDVLNVKDIDGVTDAKILLRKLEERNLMKNTQFLDQLLRTIHRNDLLQHLGTNIQHAVETDANPLLSNYRVMLYRIYDETTQENFQTMKFLLSDVVSQRKRDDCKTALDLFVELEKVRFLSPSSLTDLHSTLTNVNQQLASIVNEFMQKAPHQPVSQPSADLNENFQNVNISPRMPTLETPPTYASLLSLDAEANVQPPSLFDQTEYYAMTHNPHGMCVIINNEDFEGMELTKRAGTQEDENVLSGLFSKFGFKVMVHKNLTAENMRTVLKNYGSGNFLEDDALVVFVLSHGESGCVFGTDEKKVYLRELTMPFRSGSAPTLAGKPKLFFIQACQGRDLQTGYLPCPPNPSRGSQDRQSNLEADAGPSYSETVPSDADFLIGMATVPEFKSYRNRNTGSIYIQELCKQLKRSAESRREEDILTVLTRVNREVSRGVYLNHKQMPEPKYTLTKKLVLKFVDGN